MPPLSRTSRKYCQLSGSSPSLTTASAPRTEGTALPPPDNRNLCPSGLVKLVKKRNAPSSSWVLLFIPMYAQATQPGSILLSVLVGNGTMSSSSPAVCLKLGSNHLPASMNAAWPVANWASEPWPVGRFPAYAKAPFWRLSYIHWKASTDFGSSFTTQVSP